MQGDPIHGDRPRNALQLNKTRPDRQFMSKLRKHRHQVDNMTAAETRNTIQYRNVF